MTLYFKFYAIANLPDGRPDEKKGVHFDMYDGCTKRLEEKLRKEQGLVEGESFDDESSILLRDSKIVSHMNIKLVERIADVELTCGRCDNHYTFPKERFDKELHSYLNPKKLEKIRL